MDLSKNDFLGKTRIELPKDKKIKNSILRHDRRNK